MLSRERRMGLSGVGMARKAARDRESVSAYPCREFRPISLMRSDITLPAALSTSPILLAAPLIRLGPANGTPHSEGMQNRTTIHLHTQTALSCPHACAGKDLRWATLSQHLIV